MKNMCGSYPIPSIVSVSDTDTIIGWILLGGGLFLIPATHTAVAETLILAAHFVTVTAGLKVVNHPDHVWLAVVLW